MACPSALGLLPGSFLQSNMIRPFHIHLLGEGLFSGRVSLLVQAGLGFLLGPPKCWDQKCEPPHSALLLTKIMTLPLWATMCTILQVGKLEFESVKKNCVTGNLEKKNQSRSCTLEFHYLLGHGVPTSSCVPQRSECRPELCPTSSEYTLGPYTTVIS